MRAKICLTLEATGPNVADTTFLRDVVEPYVREWLAKNFGKPFQSEFLSLTRVLGKPAVHEFDAVSSDRKIICGIKTASWKTSGGNRGDGKIKGAYAEIYFLDHVEAQQKFLVLTDEEFYRNLATELSGKLPADIDLLLCKLPDDLEKEVKRVRATSRRELGF